MGMYDTFMFERKCPKCPNQLGEWQTKQLVREIRRWYIHDAVHQSPPNCDIECHAWCNYCDEMIYAWVRIKDGIYTNHIIPPLGEEVSGIRVKVDD